LAWLHAAPKQNEKDTSPKARMESIRESGGEVELPDLETVEYLAAWWQDIGMVESGGMGQIPLSSGEVIAWATGTGRHLTPWEFSTLRQMSRAYLQMAQEAEQWTCPAPYGSGTWDRQVVQDRLRQVFAARGATDVENGG